MLVLSRKCSEKIVIGENIVITVVRVQGGTVKLGIEAPREVRVLRSELPALPPGAESFAAPSTSPSAQGEAPAASPGTNLVAPKRRGEAAGTPALLTPARGTLSALVAAARRHSLAG